MWIFEVFLLTFEWAWQFHHNHTEKLKHQKLSQYFIQYKMNFLSGIYKSKNQELTGLKKSNSNTKQVLKPEPTSSDYMYFLLLPSNNVHLDLHLFCPRYILETNTNNQY